jgi:hypothetical protein
MDLGLVLTEILFLLESLIAFLALERLFKFFEKAPPPLFWRVNDGIRTIRMRLNHDD